MLSGTSGPPPGWPKRFREAIKEYLEWLGSKPTEEGMKYLTSHPGIGEKTAERLLRERMTLIDNLVKKPDELIVKGRIKDDALRILLEMEDGEFRKRLLEKAALADEPVTTDTKRLIRMPTSLHGGSGMRVQPLELRDLHDFDPLVDAVVFATRDVRVDLKFALTMPMLGSTYELQKGISTVPEAVAVFLCCRGMAEIA
jgi:DNA primase small subunit